MTYRNGTFYVVRKAGIDQRLGPYKPTRSKCNPGNNFANDKKLSLCGRQSPLRISSGMKTSPFLVRNQLLTDKV